MSDAKSPERREERVTINKEFESFDAFITEYVTNISRSGVFIRSKSPLPIGTIVNLHFTVIMEDIEAIEGTGEVVRVDDDPPGMGVVFTEISSYSKDLIDKLLTKRLEVGKEAGEGSSAQRAPQPHAAGGDLAGGGKAPGEGA